MKQIEIKNGWKFAVLPSVVLQGRKADPGVFSHQALMPATVPGCVELDLQANGKGGDPYFGQNPYTYRYLEGKDFLYITEFEADPGCDTLHFAGIDTIADIFLNGALIGHTENMFLEYDFPVSLIPGKNKLAVYIYSPTLSARKYDIPAFCDAQKFNFETLYIRKSASMYGWDIMPRFVSGGLFRPVTLYKKKKTELKDVGLFTLRATEGTDCAPLRFSWSFETEDVMTDGYRVEICGTCGDSKFSASVPAYFTSGVTEIRALNPRLWYPRNYGEQNLYRTVVTLTKDGTVLDTKEFEYGIRSVELIRTSTTTQRGDGEFCFRINGKKIFVLGTNWVPLDAFPCRYEERMPEALEELLDIGCNAVRVWGGGSYQPDSFYDFCDRNGILVWQDFCMGCAVYPNDDAMVRALREEATAVVKRLRHHASICLWAGDNECDEVPKWHWYNSDPNGNILTRKVLSDVIRWHDYTRPYLPSSPYTDEEAYRTKLPIPEQHLWGPRDYFKGDYYRNDPCHFASETGYHGCPSPESLKKFISADHLYPFISDDGRADEDWICHASGVVKGMSGPYAYRIPLMDRQVKTMFGTTVPGNLTDFCKASQISQAEALKFFIEHFRMAKWRRTGIIWWNLLDGWPQISDAIIDWYHVKKLAYHFVKRAQSPLLLSLEEPADGKQQLIGINDTQNDEEVSYTVRDITTGKILLTGTGKIPADGTALLGELQEQEDYHFLSLEMKTTGGTVVSSHFITKARDISYPEYLADLKAAGFDRFEGF